MQGQAEGLVFLRKGKNILPEILLMHSPSPLPCLDGTLHWAIVI